MRIVSTLREMRQYAAPCVNACLAGFLPIFFSIFFSSNPLNAQDCIGTVINISNGAMGSWTAPDDEGPGPWLIEVVAKGAGGGDAGSNANGNSGGQGAEIRAQFIVANSEVILAIAGQAGSSALPGHGLAAR